MKKRKIKGYCRKRMQFISWKMLFFDDTELYEEE